MKSNQTLRDPLDIDRRRIRSQVEFEEPILAELLSLERLEQHAKTLAAAQGTTDAPRRGRDVQPGVAENGRILVESYRVLARDQGRTFDHSGRRVVGRQLPDRRRAAPRDP